MEEFEINVFYAMYKKSVVTPREEFKKKFKQRHGDFKHINELMLRIENYQIDNFGEILRTDTGYPNREESQRKSINAKNRKRYYENKRV